MNNQKSTDGARLSALLRGHGACCSSVDQLTAAWPVLTDRERRQLEAATRKIEAVRDSLSGRIDELRRVRT